MNGLMKAFLTAICSTLFGILLLLNHVTSVNGERIMGVDNDDFDFDGVPGSMHEFKVAVPGNSEECFYQPVKQGTSFFVNFNVIKGGDGKVDFYVKNQNSEIIESQIHQSSGVYRLEESPGGLLIVCIDNIYNQFSSKLVHLSLMSVIISHWQDFQKEVMDLNLVTQNFTASLTNVQTSISAMMQSQTSARFHVIKDWYLVNNNHFYVLAWSSVQCVLIVLASVTQVFIVRRLFKTTNVTPSTFKPRA